MCVGLDFMFLCVCVVLGLFSQRLARNRVSKMTHFIPNVTQNLDSVD